MDELGPTLDDAQRKTLAEWTREVRNVTPEQLASYAHELGRIHSRLRECFISNLLETDPALEPILRASVSAE